MQIICGNYILCFNVESFINACVNNAKTIDSMVYMYPASNRCDLADLFNIVFLLFKL